MATPYIRLVSLPLVMTRPVVAYNLHLFPSFVLFWAFMMLLCYDLTGSRAAIPEP